MVSRTGLVDAFRLNDPIVTPCGFSRCNMPAMDLPGYESESKRALGAQLRATLDVIPAHTWYADPSGALTFVINDMRIISVYRKTILSDSALPRAQRGIRILRFCMRMTTKSHAKSGQPVCAPAAPVNLLSEFVTLKESTAGSSLVPNPSGRAMELSCIGSG